MNKNKFIENNKDLTMENIKINTENISLTNAITNNTIEMKFDVLVETNSFLIVFFAISSFFDFLLFLPIN